MQIHEISNTLTYLKEKRIPFMIKTCFIKNEKSFIIGNLVKEGRFYKIKDINGSHIIAGNMVESIMKLKRVVIELGESK